MFLYPFLAVVFTTGAERILGSVDVEEELFGKLAIFCDPVAPEFFDPVVDDDPVVLFLLLLSFKSKPRNMLEFTADKVLVWPTLMLLLPTTARVVSGSVVDTGEPIRYGIIDHCAF
jgi:hypothetical protein